jgi:adenine-specific DNA-methyltransferase
LVLEDYGNGRQIFVEYKEVEGQYSKIYSIIKSLSETGKNHLEQLGLEFDNPKPEEIIKYIIFSSTQEGDIVLDFCLGSGTTCAVAHKMNRQYIGVEQMDYIENVSVERMKKVIAGEDGGISKSVNWNGGGSFIYCELLKDSAKYVDEIMSCDAKELPDKFTEIKDFDFLKPYIDRNELTKLEKDFSGLPVSEQRKNLILLVEKSTLYVNYADIENLDYDISEEDKKLTKQFYR